MNNFKIGQFLAIRRIRRGSPWTTVLIISVMTLTFLNLVFVVGILTGLIEGATQANRVHYTREVFLEPLPEKNFIERSNENIEIIKNIPGVTGLTPRYVASGQIQSNFKDVTKSNEKADVINAFLVGIDPDVEHEITRLGDFIEDGEYLDREDQSKILIGSNLLSGFVRGAVGEGETLENVEVGSTVRMTLSNGVRKELDVKGIIKSKAGDVDRRIYFLDRELRNFLGRTDFNVSEIAVRVDPSADPVKVKSDILASGIGKFATVETSGEALGQFLDDIKNTFALLGTLIGSIGLVVASITIFIVIFINALTRRKYIGILKAIGISKRAIEFSYMMQAFFYAAIGIILGVLIVFFVLKPYFDANPINFPFSDGILFVETHRVIINIILLSLSTVVAGFIPARMIVRGNTLDAILGR